MVFQYNGLLEAGPAGGYQRLSKPGRPGLVTWSPGTESYKQTKRSKWRTKNGNDLKRKAEVTENVKFSHLTQSPSQLVTWVPRMSAPARGTVKQDKESESDTSQEHQESLARKEVMFESEPAIIPKKVFYKKHKVNRFTDLVWTGERFDPMLLELMPCLARSAIISMAVENSNGLFFSP